MDNIFNKLIEKVDDIKLYEDMLQILTTIDKKRDK